MSLTVTGRSSSNTSNVATANEPDITDKIKQLGDGLNFAAFPHIFSCQTETKRISIQI